MKWHQHCRINSLLFYFCKFNNGDHSYRNHLGNFNSCFRGDQWHIEYIEKPQSILVNKEYKLNCLNILHSESLLMSMEYIELFHFQSHKIHPSKHHRSGLNSQLRSQYKLKQQCRVGIGHVHLCRIGKCYLIDSE